LKLYPEHKEENERTRTFSYFEEDTIIVKEEEVPVDCVHWLGLFEGHDY
jgi:hypothetical protein